MSCKELAPKGVSSLGDATEEKKSPGEFVPVRHGRFLRRGPFWERGIDQWFGEFDRLFPWTRLWGRRVSASVEGRLAAADLYETANEVVVKADLPGVPKDNIEITLTDSTLTLRGEKKEEEGISHEAYHFRERSFGTFNRTIDLPANVRSDQATATITNGVTRGPCAKDGAGQAQRAQGAGAIDVVRAAGELRTLAWRTGTNPTTDREGGYP